MSNRFSFANRQTEVLASSHHHHVVALGDSLNLIGNLMGEPFLQLQAVCVLVGYPSS
jgi:hypothetical protein